MSSYEEERSHVERLLTLIGITAEKLTDPKMEYAEETGVDIIARIGGRKIGVQVTEYNPDRGLPRRPRKQSRAKERSIAAKQPGGYGFSVSGQYITALAQSLKSKLTKTFSSVDEGWLLIAAQNPNWGSTSSTFVAADHISIDRMNAELHPLLAGKHFAKAFLLLAVEGVLFEWSQADKWRVRADQRLPLNARRVNNLRKQLGLSKR